MKWSMLVVLASASCASFPRPPHVSEAQKIESLCDAVEAFDTMVGFPGAGRGASHLIKQLEGVKP